MTQRTPTLIYLSNGHIITTTHDDAETLAQIITEMKRPGWIEILNEQERVATLIHTHTISAITNEPQTVTKKIAA